MYLERLIDKELQNWKNTNQPKPILLRGARQVGKTYTVRNLGSKFKHFIEINFESSKKIHTIFDGNIATDEILEAISTIYNTPILEGQTLLFFDEIQACIPAIQSLRFLYEQQPGLHVIAAGSLLEFALSEIPSFGVGRIRSIFMYPFSFDEYLQAIGEDKLIEAKQKAGPQSPVIGPIHDKLNQYLRKFLILGGMPEVISSYISNRNLNQSFILLNDLKNSYFDDFAKYKKIVPPKRIRDVFNSVVFQAGGKFVYSKTESEDTSVKIKEALELLILAGLAIPVTHTSANGLPLGAEVNNKKRKILLMDTGLFLNILDLDIGKLILTDDFSTINKGSLTEIFVGLELMKYSSPYDRCPLYYWHREARNSNAEVDYLISRDNEIIPIEVKSGTKGSMQSMRVFLQSKGSKKGIRISGEDFSSHNDFDVYPLYAVRNII